MLRHISAACRIIYEMASSAAAGGSGRQVVYVRGGVTQFRCGSELRTQATATATASATTWL